MKVAKNMGKVFEFILNETSPLLSRHRRVSVGMKYIPKRSSNSNNRRHYGGERMKLNKIILETVDAFKV